MYNHKEIESEARKKISKKDIQKAVKDDTENRKFSVPQTLETQKVRGKTRKKLFSFLEGPPTANAPPALHHLEVRTYKDIINKFRYMQGYNVPRKAGWDCHGLPVEVQIEKKLKLNSKKDILTYGEAKFINEARKSVFEYIQSWNKSTEKLNYWIDLENPYVTLNNDYIESVWWSLKQLYDKKLLYEDHKVVPFCPRCQTPLSSHEVAQGYKKVIEDSVTVKFKLVGKKDEYFLAWSTTPWTLPANLALAVNPELDYVYVNYENVVYIVAKELVNNFFKNPKIIKSVKGKQLFGIKYEPLMPYFKDKDAFVVIGGDFVSVEDGTGIVHMAPAFGEVDYDACKKEGLPFVQPIDENGKFSSEVPEYMGKFIKDADREIIQKLKHENKLFKIIKYEHDYPFCWRCDTPLMYYAIKSWFIKVSKYKDKLIKLNKKINWVPKHIKDGRFGEWLRNVKDWALSRKKFWGTPLPIWRCSCGNEEIIGSIEELKKKSLEKISDKEIELHKPWIDSVKLKCSKCKKEMSRVPEVIDCWYDSGSASFAQFHYPFENKELFKKRFPYDFIAEAIDQTRGWFYTLHVLGIILFDDIAYKNVICAGHIVDENGEKMSKSKGNILNPDEVIEAVGVDATRLQFCTVDIGDSKRFGINMVKQDILPFLNILWNTSQFYKQLEDGEKNEKHIEDLWILSRLNSVIKETTEALENYYIERGLKPIMDFVVNDFSRTYIKLVRDRNDKDVKKIIEEVLETVSKILAPYAPYISDFIYSSFSKNSVHLSSWPKVDSKKINKKVEEEFGVVLQIIEKGLAERDKAKIGLRWPLARAVIYCDKELKKMSSVILNQLNVKKIEFKKSKEMKVELDTNTTKELEAEGYSREISRQVQAFRKKLGLEKKNRIELTIITDAEFKKILEKQKENIGEKTNSKTIEIVTTQKEKFKKKTNFTIKDKRGEIAIKLTTNQ